VLLKPSKGTQGREMNRNIRIASALALASFIAGASPLAAYAGSPLLSGYGGPGAGEQAIVGSTLIGGPRGGAGSGGSLGSSSSGAGGGGLAGSSSGSGATNAGTRASHTGGTQAAGGGSNSKIATGSTRQGERSNGSRSRRAQSYVYPSALASTAGDSSVIGISTGDVFPLVAILTTLVLIGVLTVRFSRLQP
jgi:hypothetical protein